MFYLNFVLYIFLYVNTLIVFLAWDNVMNSSDVKLFLFLSEARQETRTIDFHSIVCNIYLPCICCSRVFLLSSLPLLARQTKFKTDMYFFILN